jgi:hypothetical protein
LHHRFMVLLSDFLSKLSIEGFSVHRTRPIAILIRIQL